jgi:hypothetical protein
MVEKLNKRARAYSLIPNLETFLILIWIDLPDLFDNMLKFF